MRIAGVNMAGLDSEQARQQVIARFAAPLRFRMRDQRWSVPTDRLGLVVSAEDAVARAFHAHGGDDIDVKVDVDRAKIRDYVLALDKRFAKPAKNAELLGLVHGRPAISDSSWGRAVRRGTMTHAIARMLRNAHPAAAPARDEAAQADELTRELRPGDRHPARLEPPPALQRTRPVRAFRVATGRAQYPTPTGLFRIVDMQRNPWWRPPTSDWAKGLKPIPPGPGNPLGHALDGPVRARRRHPRDP